MNIIIIEQNGSFKGAKVIASNKTLAQLKVIKEKNGRTVYEVTDEQMDNINAGYEVSIVDSAVVLTSGQGAIDYQNSVINEKRRVLYGTLEQQQEMHFADIINSTTTWTDHRATVDSANPYNNG